MSEIMLQQTTVAAVVPYFERWMARFPTVESLAESPLDDVLAHWQGLGYYRRARHLHAGARFVLEAGLPADAAGWLRVPGVGRYTAGAVASIALGQPTALVDGNVERVYARLTGDDSPGSALTRRAWDWAEASVDPTRPGDWNQALMELGATVCTPRRPQCAVCPVQADCRAAAEGTAESLPRPTPKPAVIELRHVMWIPTWEGRVGVRPVPEGRWWAGMWEFPREESAEALARVVPTGRLRPIGEFRHTVTRHRITVELAEAACVTPVEGLDWLRPMDTADRAMPAPARKALSLFVAAGRAEGSSPARTRKAPRGTRA